MPGMNELQRLTYLQAMGVDTYVSRIQLPGAAQTRRLAIVSRANEMPTADVDVNDPVARQSSPVIPRVDSLVASPAASATTVRVATPAVSFNMAAVFAGGVAWLEALEGRPLAREQVKLIHAMARAINGDVAVPKVAQFDWPMHSSRQLDQGLDAARAALAAFLLRHIEEQDCRGLVSLGEVGAEFIDREQLAGVTCVTTLSTFAMLESPARKKQVWSDLQPLALRG